MGFYFRKSIGAGPFRINLSKSGVGYSVGGRGFRTGVSAKGKRYTTFSLPGTGVGYRTSGGNAGCAPAAIALLAPIIGIAVALVRSLHA